MLPEIAPKRSVGKEIVELEDAVRQAGLRTGNLPTKIPDEKIAAIAREIIFCVDPSKKYPELAKTWLFHEGVLETKNEVTLKLYPTNNLSGDHPLMLPNIQKLMLLRARLLKQGYLHFKVQTGREILTIPLRDGFTTLAARMIINQLKDYDRPSNDPEEGYRQFGYYSTPTSKTL